MTRIPAPSGPMRTARQTVGGRSVSVSRRVRATGIWPEGPKHESPGQRPGGRVPLSIHALKGHDIKSIRYGRRRSVTLLEVLLAMGLLIVVSSMTYWFYVSSLKTRNRGVAEAYRLRLTRSFLTRVSKEIQQASLITNEGRVGIRGRAEHIWLSTLRLPSEELARRRRSGADAPPAEYDLAKIEYKIARHPDILTDEGYERPLGIARVEILRPRADSAQTGEAFQDQRQVVGESDPEAPVDEAALDQEFFGTDNPESKKSGNASIQPEIAWEELYVPELHFLRFCYYDGHTWWDSWEIEGENPLPQIVMVTVGFEDHPPFDDPSVPPDVEEFCSCLNKDPVDCEPLPADQFSLSVRVPQSDPLFRSRIGRETQSVTERLGQGGPPDETP